MTDARIILTTAASREEAQKIASGLLTAQLAACVNIVGPIESHYWWKGAIENAAEFLLLVKTSAAVVEQVSGKIRELHSYEVPEVIVVNIEEGDARYLEWIRDSVR